MITIGDLLGANLLRNEINSEMFFLLNNMLYLSPLSDKASIKVKNNKNFTVETVNNRNKNIYIQGVELNGKILIVQ